MMMRAPAQSTSENLRVRAIRDGVVSVAARAPRRRGDLSLERGEPVEPPLLAQAGDEVHTERLPVEIAAEVEEMDLERAARLAADRRANPDVHHARGERARLPVSSITVDRDGVHAFGRDQLRDAAEVRGGKPSSRPRWSPFSTAAEMECGRPRTCVASRKFPAFSASRTRELDRGPFSSVASRVNASKPSRGPSSRRSASSPAAPGAEPEVVSGDHDARVKGQDEELLDEDVGARRPDAIEARMKKSASSRAAG